MKILSLFDHSGNWSKPYRDAGYEVVQVDLKLGDNVLDIDEDWLRSRGLLDGSVRGILASPPCTDFTISGARWWGQKDEDGSTDLSVRLVRKTLEIIALVRPDWWVIENPVGRMPKLVPELQEFGPFYFQPCWYGDAYTKKTGLWGTFSRDLPRNDVEPVYYYTKDGKRGSWHWRHLGGKSERTKELRSVTPMGFARAFFSANP